MYFSICVFLCYLLFENIKKFMLFVVDLHKYTNT